MIKVITYGTYDLLHYGHIRLLERAKALGDYLIVGVTADDFDKTRGKINVQQSLMERVEAVRATGIADEIIIEEYEGQKIDDIRRLDVDIFTVGSDWVGKFDYLNEYCKVVYLDRTEGVSSSQIRSEKREIRFGIVGETVNLVKFLRESSYVNGADVAAIYAPDTQDLPEEFNGLVHVTESYAGMLHLVDAVYIISKPAMHHPHIKEALLHGKHVLCEAPLSLSKAETSELIELAREKKCVLMEGIKTAYSTAYYRLLLLVKSGVIGDIVSIDSTCTSIRENDYATNENASKTWNSLSAWGPAALLPIFQILGTNYTSKQIVSKMSATGDKYDLFTRVAFVYKNAVATIKVGKGVKSEGELIITGTKGCIYVPAPWWKMDYFEVHFEDQEQNKRYFYQLDGEGIRYMIVAFVKAINTGRNTSYVSDIVTEAISGVIGDYYTGNDAVIIE